MDKKQTEKPEHPFTLRQHAAFALASNQACGPDAKKENQTQDYKDAIGTQHFFNLVVKGNLDFDQHETWEMLIGIRNFSSHTRHNDLPPISAKSRDFYKSLEKRARWLFAVRNREGRDENEAVMNWLTQNEAPLFDLAPDQPVNRLPQPEIAFLVAPFLAKGEVAHLLGKIYFGKDASVEKNGEKADAPRTVAIKALLKLIAIPDSAIVRDRQDSDEPWLDPKYEQAFAIYENLRQNFPEGSDKIIPEKYLMQQLLLFIDHQEILPGYQFARIKTERAENAAQSGGDLLEQHITYNGDHKNPFYIRHNTITAKNGDGIMGTFSLESLCSIVAVFLKEGGKAKIADFVTEWLNKHKDYSHRIPRQPSSKSLKETVEARCAYLLGPQNRKSTTLHHQIRFICRRINHVWKLHHGVSLGKDEYKRLEEKVRYFSKEDLRQFLTDAIWQKSGVGLGRGNDKALGKCITKDRLEDVYSDLSKAWSHYLKGVQEGLHKRSEDELQNLADDLGCRKPILHNQERPKPTMPVGLPPKEFQQKFGINGNYRFYQGLFSLYTYPEPENSLSPNTNPATLPAGKTAGKIIAEDRNTRREWCRKKLLLTMASKSVEGLVTENYRSKLENFESLAEAEIKISTGNHSIIMKFGKAWRNHARHNKKMLTGLCEHYLNDSGDVSLMRADEKIEGHSIQSALVRCRQERFLFMQAVIECERCWVNKNEGAANTMTNDHGGHIPFAELCEKAAWDKDCKAYRNAAFHGKVMKFSNCPQPLKDAYDNLEKKQNEKRKKQLKNARK